MGRPRTPIGTFGEIHFEKTPSGQVRARARYRDDDGQVRRVSAVGSTQKHGTKIAPSTYFEARSRRPSKRGLPHAEFIA
jgi:hypothetical protein